MDHPPPAPHPPDRLLRAIVGTGWALAALRLSFPPAPIESASVFLWWFGFGIAIGVAIGRWWAALLAPLPWLGLWYARATGPEYLSRPNDFPEWASLTLIALPGLVGIALGVWLQGGLLGRIARWLGQPAPAQVRPVLVATLIALLGGAALDAAVGRRFLRPVRPVEVRRYDEAATRAAVTGLSFAVYAAPAGEGAPTAMLGSSSSPPGLGPTPTFTLIYCDDRCRQRSEVQILSAPPEYGPAARQRGGTASKPEPTPTIEETVIAGVPWQIFGGWAHPGSVTADAILPDAYVRIVAPSRADFERVAAGLRQVAPP